MLSAELKSVLIQMQEKNMKQGEEIVIRTDFKSDKNK